MYRRRRPPPLRPPRNMCRQAGSTACHGLHWVLMFQRNVCGQEPEPSCKVPGVPGQTAYYLQAGLTLKSRAEACHSLLTCPNCPRPSNAVCQRGAGPGQREVSHGSGVKKREHAAQEKQVDAHCEPRKAGKGCNEQPCRRDATCASLTATGMPGAHAFRASCAYEPSSYKRMKSTMLQFNT